jgi:hypothetical protein
MALEAQTSGPSVAPIDKGIRRPSESGGEPIGERGTAIATETAAGSDRESFTALSFNDWMNNLDAGSLRLLTGGRGGGGSRSSSSSSGSSGGGIGDEATRDVYRDADLLRGSTPVIDPTIMSDLQKQVVLDMQNDQEQRDAVIAGQDANLAEMEEDFERRRDAQVTDLFGTGAERSSLANRATTDIAFDQSIAEGRVRAQTLGLLADITQREEAKRMAAWTTVLGIQAQMDTAFIGANAQITGAQIGAEAMVKAASIGARAQVKSAKISASATRAASRNSMLATIYGIDVGQQQFGADLDYRYEALDVNSQLARDQMAQDKRIAAQNRKAAKQNQIVASLGTVLGGFAGRG